MEEEKKEMKTLDGNGLKIRRGGGFSIIKPS